VASIPEIVLDGETGLLLPPGRPAALAPALDRLRAAETWRAFSTAGRRRVEERFTWAAAARRSLESYGLGSPP
jgi:glycosyltransferase involved in cell wall biosynthesis